MIKKTIPVAMKESQPREMLVAIPRTHLAESGDVAISSRRLIIREQ